MTIALPDNKFSAYSIVISEMLKQGWTSKGELEMNIGQWVLLVQIIPTVHHFLSRLRFLKKQAENRRQITIDEQCKEDLQFLILVLDSVLSTDSRLQIGFMSDRPMTATKILRCASISPTT
jgi:hypothetical protein